MTRTLFLVPAIALFAISANAQDSRFVNVNQNLVQLNPSFAGSNGGLRNQASFMDIYPNLSGSYNYYSNTLDFAIKPIKGAVAVEVLANNQADVIRNTGFGLTYAQQFTLLDGKVRLVPSLRVLHVSRVANLSAMTFQNPGWVNWHPSANSPTARKNLVSFSTGFATFIGDKLTAGAYFFHVNRPDEGLLGVSALPMHSVIHAAYTFNIGEKHQLQLIALGGNQGTFRYVTIGANALLYKHLIVGSGYHNADAVFLNAGFHHKNFNVVLGYDITVSKLAGNTAGSWEVSASFSLFRPDKETRVPFEKM